MNTDASILVYKFRPERTGFNMYAKYTRPQLTFLALVPCYILQSLKTSLKKLYTAEHHYTLKQYDIMYYSTPLHTMQYSIMYYSRLLHT